MGQPGCTGCAKRRKSAADAMFRLNQLRKEMAAFPTYPQQSRGDYMYYYTPVNRNRYAYGGDYYGGYDNNEGYNYYYWKQQSGSDFRSVN